MSEIDRLLDIMARLRDPETGCPWDVEQDFQTIAPYTVEEAFEVADAIARDDMDDLRDELGDLLFQVVFHAQMAREKDAFDFEGVVSAICEKMVRRHPHVFGGAEVADAAQQSRAWEAHKAAERADRGVRRNSILDDIPRGMPALARAQKLGGRAARAGFDWEHSEDVVEKLHEEIDELARARKGDGNIAEEIGDLLFTVVNLCRHEGVDAEGVLRSANAKFENRFRRLESRIAEEGRSPEEVGIEKLEKAWEAVKTEEDGA
jgi:MazG family protein